MAKRRFVLVELSVRRDDNFSAQLFFIYSIDSYARIAELSDKVIVASDSEFDGK
jgi:hypothetical protein